MEMKTLFERRDVVAKNLIACIKDHGYNKKSFSLASGISRPTLDKLLNSRIDNLMTFARHIEKALKVLDMRMDELLNYQFESKTLSYDVQSKLPLPVGVSDYRLACSEYYYVDKTMMIKDFIDERPMVSLFTRPRRFGKSLNMDMLKTFFEKSDEDTSVFFRDKKIWSCGEKYQSYQGKYPVLYISFKDIKYDTWDNAFQAIREVFSKEAARHMELLESSECNKYEKAAFERLLASQIGEVECSNVLLDLSRMLHKHHGIAPIIIVDEYDIPIQQGYMKGYYDEVVLFMRNLFSGGFKDNKHLSFGFLTGILRVAKESIFSGLNNLVIHSVLDQKYSSYFGFTMNEVSEMLSYYGVREKMDEICEWYDGYRFGKSEILNPWSVINYLSFECLARPYWQSTGSNDIIGEILSEADSEVYEKLTALMNGETFVTTIDNGVIYPQVKKNPSSIYSFLLVTGYLRVLKSELSFSGDFMCEVGLPNREISYVYQKEIIQQLIDIIPFSSSISISEALFTGNAEKLKESIGLLMKQSVSCYDGVKENFYHGLMLGLCALTKDYFVTSNRESGHGRYDIQMKPKKNGYPGILIEIKMGKDLSQDELALLSQKALNQISERQYDTDLISSGIKLIDKFGVAFSGKNVEICIG